MDALSDALEEIRCSGIETGIECEYSGHFETESVASQMPDGSWVGWTYYYGGGKYSEPGEIHWMEDAYDLNCAEEEKVVIVQTFEKI